MTHAPHLCYKFHIMKFDNTRAQQSQILDEAERMVLAEGHRRLRVTSVAHRLGMSHANVYRFFPNRRALIEAVGLRHLHGSLESVRQALTAPGTSLSRLESAAVALAKHRLRQESWGSHELVAMLFAEDSPAVHQHLERHIALFREALEQGVARGELVVQDAPAAAEALMDALTVVYHPALPLHRSSTEHEQQARRIARWMARAMAAPAVHDDSDNLGQGASPS